MAYPIAKSRRSPGVPVKHFEPATAHQKRIFLEHRKLGETVGESRKAADLPWAKLKHAMASDPAFAADVEEMEEFFLDKLEDVAGSMAHNKDGPMIRWILERRRPERYGLNAKLEVSHRFESLDDIKKLSDDELKDILATFKEVEFDE